MIVDHIGYAVKDIEKARIEFEKLGYSFEKLVIDPDRNLKIQFGSNKDTRIELLQTNEKEFDSPVESILKKNGPCPYHLCYKTDDIELEIEKLKRNKWVLIHSPAPAVAFDQDRRIRVAFLMNRHIGMIELVES